jgi:tetratricopeptide (TPR) repeat protein
LAILGMGLTFFSRNEKTVFINLWIASQIIFTLIFFLTDRHRATILPFLIMYEAYTLNWAYEQIKSYRFQRLILPAIIFSLFVVIFRPQSLNPNAIRWLKLTKLGFLKETQRDYPQARELYEQALLIHPNDTNTLYNLGNVYLKQGQYPNAVEYYEKVLGLNPYHVDALFNLGAAYQEMGNYEKALLLYKTALDLQPDSADVHYRLGQLYQHAGECEKAEVHYRAVRKMKPELGKVITELTSSCPRSNTPN